MTNIYIFIFISPYGSKQQKEKKQKRKKKLNQVNIENIYDNVIRKTYHWQHFSNHKSKLYNVTGELTAKKPGSALCPTLVIEYETTLLYFVCNTCGTMMNVKCSTIKVRMHCHGGWHACMLFQYWPWSLISCLQVTDIASHNCHRTRTLTLLRLYIIDLQWTTRQADALVQNGVIKNNSWGCAIPGGYDTQIRTRPRFLY